ncbi:MAG: bifunctional enoyl-CoA hydratase/phosphate acetyltransferase [Planctomycetota bacterium]
MAGQLDVLAAAGGLAPLVTAVAHPCDAPALAAALAARDRGLIVPILVGPEPRIRHVAAEAGLDLAGASIVHAPHSHAAAARAVELVRRAEAEAIMKGSLHTDELLAEVVHRETGLRTARRISHVFVLEVPGYDRLLLVTDGAVNIDPSLEEKADIVQNAIDLAVALGIERPKVAILSAVETVTSKLRSTLDAAALCKMADRRQISGGIIDGPLAFDNAVSAEAARTKEIESPVAGRADILVAPDLESGNILAKQFGYFSRATAGGIVLGARVPIILSSRADSAASRLLSCGVAVLFARRARAAGP